MLRRLSERNVPVIDRDNCPRCRLENDKYLDICKSFNWTRNALHLNRRILQRKCVVIPQHLWNLLLTVDRTIFCSGSVKNNPLTSPPYANDPLALASQLLYEMMALTILDLKKGHSLLVIDSGAGYVNQIAAELVGHGAVNAGLCDSMMLARSKLHNANFFRLNPKRSSYVTNPMFTDCPSDVLMPKFHCFDRIFVQHGCLKETELNLVLKCLSPNGILVTGIKHNLSRKFVQISRMQQSEAEVLREEILPFQSPTTRLMRDIIPEASPINSFELQYKSPLSLKVLSIRSLTQSTDPIRGCAAFYCAHQPILQGLYKWRTFDLNYVESFIDATKKLKQILIASGAPSEVQIQLPPLRRKVRFEDSGSDDELDCEDTVIDSFNDICKRLESHLTNSCCNCPYTTEMCFSALLTNRMTVCIISSLQFIASIADLTFRQGFLAEVKKQYKKLPHHFLVKHTRPSEDIAMACSRLVSDVMSLIFLLKQINHLTMSFRLKIETIMEDLEMMTKHVEQTALIGHLPENNKTIHLSKIMEDIDEIISTIFSTIDREYLVIVTAVRELISSINSNHRFYSSIPSHSCEPQSNASGIAVDNKCFTRELDLLNSQLQKMVLSFSNKDVITNKHIITKFLAARFVHDACHLLERLAKEKEEATVVKLISQPHFFFRDVLRSLPILQQIRLLYDVEVNLIT